LLRKEFFSSWEGHGLFLWYRFLANAGLAKFLGCCFWLQGYKMAYKLRFAITTVMLLQEKSHARRQVTVFYSSTFCLQHTPLTKAMT